MAGGKLSPRQKMINLMYLVFIAMLALQMSKEVLTAFGYLNQRLDDFNVTQVDKNALQYEGLALKASEQPDKFGDENEKAKQIRILSQELYTLIDTIKEVVLDGVAEEDRQEYETLDKADNLDVYLYQKGKVTENGQAFLDAIAKYKNGVISVLGSEYEIVSKSVEEHFDTDDVEATDGVSQAKNWIDHSFVGFPAVASLTKLTLMQTDIRSAERQILSAMLGGQLQTDANVSANTYKTIFLPEKPSFFPGERVKGQIVLGRYDASLKPKEVLVNGRVVEGRQEGAAYLDIAAGSVGEQPIKGKFVFMQDGEEVEIPIDTEYTVVGKPSDAVISADKMNVVYRGLDNPLTISVPGVADKDVRPSAPGLKKASGLGKYMMTPAAGKEVVINVSYTLPGGLTESSRKTYRIKDIPKPMATVRKESGLVKMPKASLEKTTVRVELPDFLFDLEFSVKSFKIKVPGQATITVTGNKLNAQAVTAVKKARVGDMIAIFDVKSTMVGNSSYIVKNAMPVNIEIQ
ncbi:MAG: gliding motility protein GldM [Urechidicola sp.]|nr:gliding motility protein GldM [Urechidicola sp.]